VSSTVVAVDYRRAVVRNKEQSPTSGTGAGQPGLSRVSKDNAKKRWRVGVVLNRGAATLKGQDGRDTAAEIRRYFKAAGHQASVKLTTGSGMGAIIDRHLKQKDIDVLIVGGGDGSVSSAAARLKGSNIALGIIPLGTMNLFARSLGMPLALADALAALVKAHPKPVDVAMVGDRLFLHQLSFGLQPELVKTRERMKYRSRVGKMFASVRAFLSTLRRPKQLALEIAIDGEAKVFRTPALVISNNLYGETLLPFADKVDEGVLGVYICTSRKWPDLIKLTADVMLGNWANNPCVETFAVHTVAIAPLGRDRKPITASLDGELVQFIGRISVKILPRALTVLVPPKSKATSPAS